MQVISRRQNTQIPAQSQNRGPANSTGDGFTRPKKHTEEKA
ncbi:single-stranded DNA-binding protein [Klebsiella pneumoniae]|nr:single-stranded DNA-binding protein [Klebsiella pneumoniae]